MESDDIYPNEGEAFNLLQGEPVAQKADREVEKGRVLQELPLLEEAIKRFDEQIALLGDLDSIPTSTRSDEKMILVNFHANDISRRFLRVQKEWLEGLIEDYSKR